MPSQQAIILRPGQQTGLVTLPGGQTVRQQAVRQPVLVNASGPAGGPTAIRVHAPGLQARANAVATANRNVVINQSGSQISVPFHALQTMQPGQGIPTGQAGHLLVKTETGQYQIVKVSPSANPGVATSVASSTPQIVRTTAVPVARVSAPPPAVNNVAAAVAVSNASPVLPASTAPNSLPPKSSAAASPATSNSGGGSSGGGAGGGMGSTQMTPDTAKHKCKNFLATLLKLASEQPPNVAANVRTLIQGLIDGKVDPETFTNKLQRELNSSPQPCLVPFLKRSLPYLQQSLLNGEVSIDGVRPPPPKAPSQLPPAAVLKTVQSVVRPPMGVSLPQRPVSSVMRTMSNTGQPVIRTTTRIVQPTGLATNKPSFIQHPSGAAIGASPMASVSSALPGLTGSPAPLVRVGALNTASPMASAMPNNLTPVSAAQAASLNREKKSSNSYSVTGDEDINDVAAMGGVNLAEESQRMQQGSVMPGTQIRSCKDETFLQTGLLHKRMAKICLERGLDEPSPEAIALVSHATQDRLKTLLEKLSVISEHRLDIVRQEGDFEVTQDVRGQLRFLGELDKIERRRHEEAERELLLRAAKSRTKTEDPEKEKLKAKAKELQRLEEEQVRHEKANNTALMAIGGPRKKLKLDGDFSGTASAVASALGGGVSSGLSGGHGGAGGGAGAPGSFVSRPRMKRVHVRDLLFLMEQEKELKRSPLLWKAHCS